MGHHIFDFLEISSYVTLISGRSIELLFFVLVKQKWIAKELLRDCFDPVINIGYIFFRGNYLKLVRSRNSNMKQYQVIALDVLLIHDRINDIYADINPF